MSVATGRQTTDAVHLHPNDNICVAARYLKAGETLDIAGTSIQLAQPVKLKPELDGVHPRVFVTAEEIEKLRVRAHTTDREEWSRVLANLAALKGDPPKPPGNAGRLAVRRVAAHRSAGPARRCRPQREASAMSW